VATTLHARSRPALGEALRIEGMGGTLGRWKQPILRLPPARVGAQNVPQLGGEHDVALTVTFAVGKRTSLLGPSMSLTFNCRNPAARMPVEYGVPSTARCFRLTVESNNLLSAIMGFAEKADQGRHMCGYGRSSSKCPACRATGD